MTSHATNIEYQAATLADVPAMVRLLDLLFTIEADFAPDTEKQTRGLSMLIQHPECGMIQVARHKDQVIGMASAQLVISTAQGALSVWVEDMVVDLQYQDRGIGKQLLNRIEEWAATKGATRMQLLVDNENSSAIGYYSHLGWETTRLQARRKFI